MSPPRYGFHIVASAGAIMAIKRPTKGKATPSHKPVSTAPGGKALTDFDDLLTAIKCPHCQDEDLYRCSARSEQHYTPKQL
jgi:hypothetical protein